MSSTEVEDLYTSLRLKVNQASFGLGDALIGKLRTGLEAIAVHEGVKWFGEMIEKSTSAAVETAHLAQRLGISTDALQELEYAAGQSGVSVETLTVGVQRLSRGLEEARTKGTGQFAEALEKLHVPLADIRNVSTDQALMRISDAFADAGPKVNKTALAMELMGRGGAALIPFLNKGADGIRELRNEAYEMGAVIDGDTIKSFEEFEEQQKSLHAGLVGLRNTMVAALLPTLKAASSAMVEWFRENREVIKQRLEQVFAAIGKALSAVATAAKWVYDILKPLVVAIIDVGQSIYDAAQHSDSLRYALEAIGAVAAIVALAVAAPWVLVVAGIGIAILVIKDLIDAFGGSASIAGDFFQFLKFKIDHMTGDLGTAAQVWFKGIQGTFELLKIELDIFLKTVDAIKTALEWVFEHSDDVKMLTGGAFVGTGSQNKAKDFLTDLGHDREAEAAVAARGGPFGGGMVGQTYGEVAQTAILASAPPGAFGVRGPALTPMFTANVTFQGDVGDTTEAADKVHNVLRDFWDGKMRELQGSTGG